MPATKGKSALFARLGAKLAKAVDAHKKDETNYGNMELPEGIEGGVAQLVDCKFTQIKEGKQNAGEYMFYAAGVVKAPASHGGVPVQGLRTQISEPMFDTPKRSRETVEAHTAWVMNEMAKLGLSRDEMSAENLEAMAEALKEAAPHFRFRTWKGEATPQYPTPRVNHQWGGACEYSENGEATAPPVSDATPDAEEEEGEGTTDADAAAAQDEDVDLDALVEAADRGKGKEASDAQAQLRKLALEAGVSEEDVDEKAKTWDEVRDMLVAAKEAGGEAEEAEEEKEFVPVKGNVYMYRPIDKATKKPAKKATELEILSVTTKSKTVTGKDLGKGQTVLGADKKPLQIGWDLLEQGD